MTPIGPARLKPGVTLDETAARMPHTADRSAGHVVTGKALVFWDPANPGQKLDAIDTDQITPATDCVSESLATLDEKWKAGSFRHLMPDFGERVRGGENF